MSFRVTHIIDGDTIQVGGWQWGEYAGKRVKVLGYTINPAEKEYNELAKNRLSNLILDKDVELSNPVRVEKGSNAGEDVLYCSVFLNNVDISKYFPELKHS